MQIGTLGCVGVLAGLVSLASPAAGEPVGPSPYLCFDAALIAGCGTSDSPFKSIDFSGGYLHFEDFEDQALNTPGVSGSGLVVGAPILPSQFDSVDEDDGTIDGSGQFHRSYYNGNLLAGPKSITFEFDAGVLGALPTHVGLAWTDGLGQTSFQAFDALGSSLGTIGPVDISDNFITGETAEDHFFGWIDAGGISKIIVSDDLTGLEIDHLQYGRTGTALPVPVMPLGGQVVLLLLLATVAWVYSGHSRRHRV